MRRIGFFITGALMGGLMAGIAALLLAPTSGSETQNRIRSGLQQLRSDIQQAGQQRREELKVQLSRLRAPKTYE